MALRNLFPYPLPATRGISAEDPLDYRFDVARRAWVHDPGWWRNILGRKCSARRSGDKLCGRKR
ncbi:MAG: hypothetical protein AB1374_05950 [Bacillota bacterium]